MTYTSAWESPLGIKIVETNLVHMGITDARVVSIKDNVVTLKTKASERELIAVQSQLRRATTKAFELMPEREA